VLFALFLLAVTAEPVLARTTTVTAASVTSPARCPSRSQPASVATAGSRLSRIPKTRRGVRRMAASSSV
jgi:hypothetical protein